MLGCVALGEFVKIAAQDDTYDAWRSVMQLCAYVEGGEALAHGVSKAHPRYDADLTQAKFDEAETNRIKHSIGPITCEKLREYVGLERRACISCPLILRSRGSPVNCPAKSSAIQSPQPSKSTV